MGTRCIIPPFHAKGPALPPPASWARVQLGGAAMGTDWQLTAYPPPGLDAFALRGMVDAVIQRSNMLFSLWHPQSEICRLNADPSPQLMLSPEMAGLLAETLALARDSGGCSDPTLGALTALWGFGPAPRVGLPTPDQIAAAKGLCGWAEVTLDGRTLIRPPGLCLDFNGSAKGWAVDRVADALLMAGVQCFLIEIGGEVFARGLKPDLRPWWVEIEQQPPNTAPRLLLALNGQGLASSGIWRRGVRHGGRLYPHLIDPQTGWPLENDLASATVLAPSAMRADALAKVLMVMGAARGLDFAVRQGLAAVMLRPDGRQIFSPAMARMMEDADADQP